MKTPNLFNALIGSLALIVANALDAQQEDKTITILGDQNSSQEYTLEDANTLDILTGGNVLARVLEDVTCVAECEECEICEECPDVCDADLDFTEFVVRANGNSFFNGQTLSVDRGTLLSVSWQAPGAYTCQATGLTGTTNWSNDTYDPFSDGNVTVNTGTMPDLSQEASYTMRLSCTNGPNLQESRQVDVVIQPEEVIEPPPSQCENVESLQEASGGVITQATDCLDDISGEDCASYTSVFGGTPFPGTQVQQRVRLFTNTYAAFEFTTPSDLNGTHTGAYTAEVYALATSGVRLMSISDCPGDFDAGRLDSRCLLSRSGPETLRWQGSDDSFRCPLEADTRYYLNILYSNDQPGTPMDQIEWACSDPDECGNLITPIHNYP